MKVFSFVFLVLITGNLSLCVGYKKVQKRGIFRHQVTPTLGGKIPHSAFDSYRLNSNLLSRNGIYSNDGVLLQQQYYKNTHGKNDRYRPSTIKLHVERNNHHLAEPGRYFNPEVIETTYVIREHVNEFPEPPIHNNNINNDRLHLVQYHPSMLKEIQKYDAVDSEETQILKHYTPILKAVLLPEQYYH